MNEVSVPFPDTPARRVVVTGLGVTSPIGLTIEQFHESLASGRSGISAVPDAGHAGPRFGGVISDFTGHINDFGDLPTSLRKQLRKSLKVMNRETQLAVAATQGALRDSGLDQPSIDPERTGVSFGAGYVAIQPEDFLQGMEKCRTEDGDADLDRWGEHGLGEVQPLWLLTCLPNMPGCYIAMYNDLQGPNNTITLGDGGATLALAEAAHMIRDNLADVMVVGGCGNNLDSCSLMHVLLDEDLADAHDDPHHILKPFDRHRTGALPAEGAAAFVLEEYEAAMRRGATIYGEFLGSGSSAVVQGRTPQRGQAIANAGRAALQAADSTPADIGHIQAHGLSSRRVDAEEATAIRAILGNLADYVPVTSAKSYFGNASAGSDAMELAAGLLALHHGSLFPVLNCRDVDSDCPINPVRNEPSDAGPSFLKLSVTPQGQAAAIVIRAAA